MQSPTTTPVKMEKKQQIKSECRQRNNATLYELQVNMTPNKKRTNSWNMEKGVSNWLTCLPIKELGYHLNKEQFWDAIRIRYDCTLPRLPTYCACGMKHTIPHALSCKKESEALWAFHIIRVRDITVKLLEEVCKDVKKGTDADWTNNGEQFRLATVNQRPEARLDISATGFWNLDQRVFLDVRVFNLNAQRHKNLELQKCYKRNEHEKKRIYNERIL